MLNTNELKEYLRIVVDLEKECYIQNRLKNELVWQLSFLGQEKDIPMPVRQGGDSASGEAIIGLMVMGAVAGAVLGFILYFFLPLNMDTCVGWGAFIMAILSLILSLWLEYASSVELDNNYRRDWLDYQDAVALEEERILKEKKEMIFLQQELDIVSSQLKKSSDILRSVYSMNIIFPKYQNFVMASSLYEYISSQRCITLEGHEGAYNILENEMRLDRIITRLDYISSQLEEIKENQYFIYSAISESNKTLSKILNSNNKISNEVRNLKLQGDELNERIACLQNTSEFQLYLTELNHKELSYMNSLKL